ncbi:MAG: cell division protein FtsA [Anaerolineae bacterium]|nr:cell division protein FtsA [Anaerolineae bacterium]
MSDIIAAIDVGTCKICALIAEVVDDEREEPLNLIGVGHAPARGLHKGMVVNVAEASEAIAQAVEEAEVAAGLPMPRAYVGISGEHISTISNRGVVAVSRSSQGITRQDVERALEAARTTAPVPHGREIIHTLARRFTLDEQTGIRDPIGMQGHRLEVEAQIVFGSSSAIANLVKCVRAYDVEVEELVLEPLASGEAVLTPAERELGVVVVDIGGGTTDMAIFLEDSLWHTVVREVGGNLFTRDVAIGLRTPFEVAEELKIRYGHVLPERFPAEEKIHAPAFGDGGSITVSRRTLAYILAARAEETLELILTEIKRSGYDGMLPAGMVLCGGTAQLPGLKTLSQKMLQWPVRIGSPNSLPGLGRDIANPAFATGIGLLLWGWRQRKQTGKKRRSPGHGPLMDRVIEWLRNLLPG